MNVGAGAYDSPPVRRNVVIITGHRGRRPLRCKSLDKLEFDEGGSILSAPLRCPQCHKAEDWKEVPSFGRGIPINNNVRIFAPRGILTVFFKMRYKCGKCGYTAKYSQW